MKPYGFKYALFASLLAASLIGWILSPPTGALANEKPPRGPNVFICQFSKIAGTFEADTRELRESSYMITVTRGDRVFMFRRSRLDSCEATIG